MMNKPLCNVSYEIVYINWMGYTELIFNMPGIINFDIFRIPTLCSFNRSDFLKKEFK